MTNTRTRTIHPLQELREGVRKRFDALESVLAGLGLISAGARSGIEAIKARVEKLEVL